MNTMVAIFDLPQGQAGGKTDLIMGPPAGAKTISDYLKYIKGNYTFELAAGVQPNNNNFFTAFTGPLLPGDITSNRLNASTLAETLATYSAALTIYQNETKRKFGPIDTGIKTPTGATVHTQLGIVDGRFMGASDDPNYKVFGNPGLADRATFLVKPVAEGAPNPEPSSIVLFALGFGIMTAAYRCHPRATVHGARVTSVQA
jgi:hypothetical protein